MNKFELNEVESQLAREFEKKHSKCVKECPTTIGGNITYSFTPTSIGIAKVLRCSLCDKSENITDYSLW